MDNSTLFQSHRLCLFAHPRKWHVVFLLVAITLAFQKNYVMPSLLFDKKEVKELAFIYVQSGKFRQGCNSDRDDSCQEDIIPSHLVTIKNDFWLSETEVTVAQFVQFLNSKTDSITIDVEDFDAVKMGNTTLCCLKSEGRIHNRIVHKATFQAIPGFENFPVTMVTMNGAKGFCRWLGKGFRLPSESEWEFAARGGSKSRNFKFSGGNNLNDVGWFWKNSGDEILSGQWNLEQIAANNCQTKPVGLKTANELGLFDMSGNAYEMCEDCWHFGYINAPQDGSAWLGDFCQTRMVRGGSWLDDGENCRSVTRAGHGYFDYQNSCVGFRVARDK